VRLDLALVEAFLAIVEARGFRAAARRLGVSQPQVSRQLRRLEERLGAVLIRRGRGSSAPTAEGGRFLPHARALMEAARRAETALLPRPLVVGAASNPGLYLLPALLTADIELRLGSNPETLARLEIGEVDVAVTEWWDGRAGFEAIAWREEGLVGIVPPGHRFATARSVPLDLFLAEPLIGGEPGTGTGRLLAAALGEGRAPLRIARAMGSTEGVKRAVAAGLGVSIVLACAIRDEVATGTLVAVRLAGVQLARTIHAVIPRDAPPGSAPRRFVSRLAGASG
jgi:DNA-binding transcriptional LysR family regulator